MSVVESNRGGDPPWVTDDPKLLAILHATAEHNLATNLFEHRLVCAEQCVECQTIGLLEVATQTAGAIRRLWRHQAKPVILDDGDYTPESVDRILRAWTVYRVAAEGGTLRLEGGAGRGDRLGIAAVLADIQWATDVTLYRLRHWACVRRIYLWQERALDWNTQVNPLGHYVGFRWQPLPGLDHEPPYPFGHQVCCERIAQCLGWRGYEYQP